MSSDVVRSAGSKCDVEVFFRPYIVERLMPAVYRRVGVPEGLNAGALIEVVRSRSSSLNRRMCLVLGPEDCWYMEPDGSMKWSGDPPSGGVIIKP